MTLSDKVVKRGFDILLSLVGVALSFWLMVLALIVASVETRSFGLFIQKRVGKEGKIFHVFKIKTMKKIEGLSHTITTSNDKRITKSGKFFRETKIDELPQLFNVLFGSMSFVGPRPDVEGYADRLEGEDRVVLSVRPGITGPASLKYKDEEQLLAQHADAKLYNDSVIWPDKVKINREYVQNWSLGQDIVYIIKTILG